MSLALFSMLLAGPAAAAPWAAEGYLIGGIGVRHAFGPGTGLLVSGGIGGSIGPMGIEYEAMWTNDHTAAPAAVRQAERSTHWLNLVGRIPLGERFSVGLSVSPGLGWVKPAGPSEEVGGRFASWGFREQLRGEAHFRRDTLSLSIGLRLGAEHHWQDAVVNAPEHSFTCMAYLRFGLRNP